MIYANNAATTWPKPEPVYAAHDRALRDAGVTTRSSSKAAPRGADALAAPRAVIAKFLNAPDPSRLLFSPGCTASLNQAIRGLPWEAGDVIAISGLEHHAVSRPARRVVRDHGVRLEVSPCRPGRPVDLDWLESILKRGRVRLVAMTMASNVTGDIFPSKAIVDLAHRHGALALLDGAQSAGVLPVDLRALGCDLFATAGHKGLFGPPGIGLLYIAPTADLKPWLEGGTGRDSGRHENHPGFPHAFEAGTHNVPAVVALAAGVTWIAEKGREWIHRTEQALCGAFLKGLERLDGVRVYGTTDLEARTSVVSLNADRVNPRDLAAWLAEHHDVVTRAGYHCSPLAHESIGTLPGEGTLRCSFGCFNTEAEVESLLGFITEGVRDLRK